MGGHEVPLMVCPGPGTTMSERKHAAKPFFAWVQPAVPDQ